jgi:outer membrane lipoprotein SlyB
MNQVKTQISRLTSNPIGAIAGAGAGYYAAKKLIKTDKMWLLAVTVLAGAVIGATVQAKVIAKSGTPTAATVAAK